MMKSKHDGITLLELKKFGSKCYSGSVHIAVSMACWCLDDWLEIILGVSKCKC